MVMSIILVCFNKVDSSAQPCSADSWFSHYQIFLSGRRKSFSVFVDLSLM